MATLSKKDQQVLAIGGGALILLALMGGSKSAKSAGGDKSGGSTSPPDNGGGGGTLPPPRNGSAELPGVIPGPVPASGPPPYGDACKSPSKGGSFEYDKIYWGTGGDDTANKILQAFSALGYNVTVDPLGPDKSMAKAGVKGDAIENEETLRFQSHYNKVSRDLGESLGGLELDGQIGPCVVTALKHLLEDRGFNAETWRQAVMARALPGVL